MSERKSLAYLQPGDAAWYRGRDGHIYEVKIDSVGQARPGVMPVWVWILWTDVEAGMLVQHPERDLLTQDPRPACVVCGKRFSSPPNEHGRLWCSVGCQHAAEEEDPVEEPVQEAEPAAQGRAAKTRRVKA